MTTPGTVDEDGTPVAYTPESAVFTTVTAAGLTGATAISRYAGASASGAPASGTFAVGDYVIDQTGAVWICTVAGTPGTWVAPAGPAIFSAMTAVALTDASTVLVNAALGNLFRVTLGGNRTLGAPSNPTDGQTIHFEIKQDATADAGLRIRIRVLHDTGVPYAVDRRRRCGPAVVPVQQRGVQVAGPADRSRFRELS
jgi:hypothetical protein